MIHVYALFSYAKEIPLCGFIFAFITRVNIACDQKYISF